jgi:hypothetical protein
VVDFVAGALPEVIKLSLVSLIEQKYDASKKRTT